MYTVHCTTIELERNFLASSVVTTYVYITKNLNNSLKIVYDKHLPLKTERLNNKWFQKNLKIIRDYLDEVNELIAS